MNTCETCKWLKKYDGYCDSCNGVYNKYEPADVKKEVNPNNCIHCKNRWHLLQEYDGFCNDCVNNSKYEFQEFIPHKIIKDEREYQYLMAAIEITKNFYTKEYGEHFTCFSPERILVGERLSKYNLIGVESDHGDLEEKYFEWIKKYFPEKYKIVFGGE